MNIFLNEYFGFWFELNFELNHFSARFNEKMNFQNVSYRAIILAIFWELFEVTQYKSREEVTMIAGFYRQPKGCTNCPPCFQPLLLLLTGIPAYVLRSSTSHGHWLW